MSQMSYKNRERSVAVSQKLVEDLTKKGVDGFSPSRRKIFLSAPWAQIRSVEVSSSAMLKVGSSWAPKIAANFPTAE